MSKYEWIPVSDDLNEIPEDANFFNCDTRDFHVICSNELPKGSYQEQNKDLQINLLEALTLLKVLKKKSGGEGDWRHVALKTGQWLKYIHFIRTEEGMFQVYSREGNVLNPHTLTEEIDWSNPYVMTE